ncbi:MAG: hypothetical protein DMG37_08090 [Acidobacteria bacterium]|nr:MAG: hypothetical protein DMG37_08090 [Acidobacteriota bacterium]
MAEHSEHSEHIVSPLVYMAIFSALARYAERRTRLVIVCAIFWLAIMLALTLSDYQTRQPRTSRFIPPAIYHA